MNDEDEDPAEDHQVVLNDLGFNKKKTPFPTIAVVGTRGCGKSGVAVAIVERFPEIQRWVAFCGTKETCDYWSARFGSAASVYLCNEKAIEQLENILEYQEKKSRIYNNILRTDFPDKYKIGLIFDDVTCSKKFCRSPMLEKLFSNGRHFKALTLINTQYLKQLPPVLRETTDYLIMLKISRRTCKMLYEELDMPLDNGDMLGQLLRVVTNQKDCHGEKLFNALVYLNGGLSDGDRISDSFKVFRHRPHFDPKKVVVGSETWRMYNNAHFVDAELEKFRKEYNKQKKLKRAASILHQQQQRSGLGLVPAEVDHFSDDSEEDSDDLLDTTTIRRKKGRDLTISLPKKATLPDLTLAPVPVPMPAAQSEMGRVFRPPTAPLQSFSSQQGFVSSHSRRDRYIF